MKNESSKEYSALELSFQMGTVLLENGAEISRVQETMERIAYSYDTDSFNVYVLTNAIFANGVEQGIKHTTLIKYVKNPTIHIGRISAVNQLSREIVQGKTDVETAFSRLDKIKNIPFRRLLFSLLCCGIGSGCFALLAGGGFLDFLSAFLCGILLEGYLHYLNKIRASKFLINLSASALMAFFASLLYLVHMCTHLDMVVTGAIIRLVPGVALTTSIRDFFNSDFLSGTIRMIDAIMVGGCISVGVGSVMKLFSLFIGGPLI